MGRGVAVPAGDGHAGLGQALLRTDHVDDALAIIIETEERNTELPAIGLDSDHHLFGQGIDEGPLLGVGGNNVIHGSEGPRGDPDSQPSAAEILEGLWARDLVDERQAYEKLGLACGQLTDRVLVPDLL